MTDLISRDDAVKTVIRKCSPICAWQVGTQQYPDCVVAEINALPSAELTLQTPQTYGKSINPSNAEVVEDLISRADAIRWVKTECNPYGKPTLEFESGKKVIEHLEQMPSTEPKMKWIPCSERLPKRDELVLVTYKTTDRIHLCRYIDDGSENPWWSYIDDCCAWNNVVLAWMPLPKPYKGGEDE